MNIIFYFITIKNSDSNARQDIEDWRTGYNTKRPDMAFGGLAPKAYADQI
jgi:transposase InsO family protein